MYSRFGNYFNNTDDAKIEDILQLIKNGANDWNLGIFYACEGGHIEIVNLMIENGADYWNGGLYCACKGGHIDIVNLMIHHGANDWDEGLYSACYGGHIDIGNLMIKNGANNFIDLKNIENLQLYKLFIYHYPDKIDKEKYEKLVIKQDPIYTIITHHSKGGIIRKLPIDLWRMVHNFL